MNDKPLCPLLSTTAIGGAVTVACQKERCMWWVEDKQKCAIALIGGKK